MRIHNIKLVTLSMLLFLVIDLTAQQEIKVPLTNPSKEGKLKMNILKGSITIKGYSGKEVIIKGTLRKESKSEHSWRKKKKGNREGLKKISNNSLEFSATEYDNEVSIRSSMYRTTDFEIQVPNNFSLKISTTNKGEIYVENVNGSIDVSNTNGKITLKDVSGSVSADALNKDITVSFVKVTPGASMAFSSLNGDIDVTFPKTIKANVKIKVDRGEVYTDFDLKSQPSKPKVTKKEKNMSRYYEVEVEKWITGAINGGGAEILFKNYNGDVIIRSK